MLATACALLATAPASWAQSARPNPAARDGAPVLSRSQSLGTPSATSAIPAGYRAWQTVPSVIRADGQDSFRLEIDAGGPVAGVRLENSSFADTSSVALADDGTGPDQVAGDGVYSAGPFTWNPDRSFPRTCFLASDGCLNSVAFAGVGSIAFDELDGSTTGFTIWPEVGLLANVPQATRTQLAPGVDAASHAVAVQTGHVGQEFLRTRDPGPVPDLTKKIYDVLPDAFDVLTVFTTSHLELTPASAGRNFVAGTHLHVSTSYTGTGLTLRDDSSFYGSAGKLQGINFLDAQQRGINADAVTHELLHQWGAYIDPALGLSDGAHYTNLTSTASLLGGFRWLPGADGSFTKDCDTGANGARSASQLDLYFMGLISGAEVDPIHVDQQQHYCDPTTADGHTTVTIADIQARHGVRSPGPKRSQKKFQLGFVVETDDRPVDADELTFYNELARYYTSEVPRGAPDPYVGGGWVPITRFFGHRTSWSSAVPLRVKRR